MIHQLPLRRISLSICLAFLISCGSKESSNAPLPTTDVERPNATLTIIDSESKASQGTSNPLSEILTSIPRFGSDQTFEIATWNIEKYPKSPQAKDHVSKVLKQLDLDLVAVEEISDEAALRDLTATLPGFDSILSTSRSDQEGAQNVGFIYRKTHMEIVESEALFERETFAFPRAPLMARFKMKDGSPDVVAIVVHLKAFGDDKSQTRREIANRQLEEFVSELRKKDEKARIVIMGDFNDRVDAEETKAVFNPWLKNEDYQMMTETLAQHGDYSFVSPNLKSLIDHIIASSNFNLEEPQIPKLQTLIPNYDYHISDHLPVMTRVR